MAHRFPGPCSAQDPAFCAPFPFFFAAGFTLLSPTCAGSRLGSVWLRGGSWGLALCEAMAELGAPNPACEPWVGYVTPRPKTWGSASPQKGYDDLQAIVPTCQQQDFSIGSQKLSKAIVLQKSES